MRRALALILTAGSFASCNELLGHHPGVLADAACEAGEGDPSNCGACGHDCLGGACVNGVCQPVPLATGLAYPSVITLDDASVYWVNYTAPSIAKLHKDGTCDDGAEAGTPDCPQVLAPTFGFNDVSTPASVATDGVNVFFANFDNIVFQQNVYELDAKGAFIRLGSSQGPNILYVANGYVYWTSSYDMNAVMRAQVGVADSAAPIAIHQGEAGISGHRTAGIVVDDARVYWAVADTGVIYSMPVGATCVEGVTCTAVVTDVPGGPWWLAMDASNLYWSNQADYTIKTAPKSGGSPKTLAFGIPKPFGGVQALVVQDGMLYWGDFSDSTVRAMKVTDPPCGPTSCAVLATNQPLPDGIAADSRAVYWTSQQAGSVMKLAR